VLPLKHLSRLIPVGLAVVALGSVLFVACGGDDDKSSSTPDSGSKDATTAASPSGGSAGGSSSPASGATKASGNALADLQAAAKSISSGNFKISYDMTTTPKSGSPETGAMTLATKGNKSYIKISGFGGQDGTAIIINDGTNSYTCIDTSKMCLKSAGAGAGTESLVDGFRPDNLIDEVTKSGATVNQVADQTVAGRSAKCYHAKDSEGEGTICIDKKSSFVVLVDSSSTDGTKIKMQAKEVADSASDDDFKPPYPVQSLGN
jgi:hypothetical protein